MEHNRTTKYRTKLHSHQVMCLHSLSKSEFIEGKSTKIAQILHEVIMHSRIQTKLDPIWGGLMMHSPIQTKLDPILENPLN